MNVKPKIVNPLQDPLGYSGANIKVKTPNGHIAEIQINTPDLIYAKESTKDARGILGEKKFNELKSKYDSKKIKGGNGHIYYEQFRNLPRAEQVGLTGEKIKKLSVDYYKNFR